MKLCRSFASTFRQRNQANHGDLLRLTCRPPHPVLDRALVPLGLREVLGRQPHEEGAAPRERAGRLGEN